MANRPQDMGPFDLAPNTAPPETADPEQSRIAERNAFYNSLPPAAKERFLDTLTVSRERGLSEEAAWEEAVVAAETTYPAEPEDAPALRDDLPLPGP